MNRPENSLLPDLGEQAGEIHFGRDGSTLPRKEVGFSRGSAAPPTAWA